ncbi:RNA polymerase subunit sigma-70 [Picosynechococcus sp. PCC 8807]|uniref:RNA polymerase subunit sigma-70 n=1 Tax=Picosynechococcus sp. PCC 8807 TaxID=195248 RepID=UPI000810DCB3|nr:RNA polymerase subunit sigma-70 [Picosynechococcus sp. PCC 8807]ANV89437.1 RNA polymerase subunit sigma-70 [Picosynechococcus sp. PCC 8807]
MIQIPSFSETNHPLILALNHYSDSDLLTFCQRYLDQGKYFTGIFCRYAPLVYTLVGHGGRSPVQTDYLFALTWRQIFHEMRTLDLEAQGFQSLQQWLLEVATAYQDQFEIPPVASINYDIKRTTPPLWCYLEQALDLVPPLPRLIVVLADHFHWSSTRISAHLQAEREYLTVEDVEDWLNQGRQLVLEELPTDIRTIYFPESLPQLNNEGDRLTDSASNAN